MKNAKMTDIADAISAAKKMAADGPRVAAVIRSGDRYCAAPGYMDADTERACQVRLVTPDGRVWQVSD